MTDFRLDRLSPRLFEHVVQELAIGVISTTVVPFGDGPDGGREATFQGATSYGADGDKWNGYGIIQAKYRTREKPADDGKWAITQLKSELKQFTRKENPRKAPDYYIYATNVVLAPNEGGAKDQVFEVLKDFGAKYGLKGFDVWDYDKLRVFIGRDEKVRRSYLAWLSSSDVLAELCEYFSNQKKDYYKVVLRYLQNEFLADQYSKLEQAGDSKDEAIPLSQVFIDLPTSDRYVSPETADNDVEEERLRFVEEIIQAAGVCLLSLGDTNLPEQVEHVGKIRGGRYVLIGGPGQGKTTVSQYICQVFRREILQTVPNRLISPEARGALDKFNAQRNPVHEPSARRLPFRIVLSEFAKCLAEEKAQSLMEFLAMKLSARSSVTLTAGEVERIIESYPAIVILDGLDEVPPATNRDELISAVTAFSIDISTSNLDVLIVATSRPQGYNEEFAPSQYVHRYLVPLAPSNAMEYGTKLARIRFGASPERFEKVVDRLNRALSKAATVRLMRTPLQVTILTLLVDRMGDPPDERWSLFRDYYQLIYERETERDIPTVAVLKSNRIEVDVIHRRIGIALQVESEKSGGTDARLTVGQFGQLVEDYLKEEGHEEPTLSNLKRQIIEAAAHRLVFLVGLEDGWVGFEIRSLQEFMAAEGITDGEDRYINDRLHAIAASPHWRNVFLFAAGRCFAERRYLRTIIEGICTELNDDPEDESMRAVLAGSELALDLLEDGPARKAPRTRGGLTRLALMLLGLQTAEAERLAGVCEEETKYIYLEDLQDRLESPGSESKIPAWQALTKLVDRFGGEFETLARDLLSRSNLSEDEIRVLATSATGRNPWLSKAITGLIEKSPVFLPSIHIIDRGGSEQYGPWAISDQPPWLSWYIRLLAIRTRVVGGNFMRMMCNGIHVWDYPLQPIGDIRNSEFASRVELPSGLAWDCFRLIREFVNYPSRQTLAAALDALFSSNIGLFEAVSLWDNYPWPLKEAFLASRTEEHGTVLRAIEAGDYGDKDEWLETERRILDGIDLLNIVSEEPIVTTSSGGLFRFPFRSASLYRFGRGRLEGSSVGALLEALSEAGSPVVRKPITRTLLRATRFVESGKPAPWIDDVLVTAIRDSPYIDSSFWQLLDVLDFDNPIWVGVFDNADLKTFTLTYIPLTARRSAVDPVSKFVQIYDARPEESGWLVPIANLALGRAPIDERNIPSNIQIATEAPMVIRAAGVICRIITGSSVLSLAEEISAIFASEPDAFYPISTAVLRRGLSYRKESSELLALIRIAGGVSADYSSILRGSFLRRPSGIDDSAEWRRLDFPEPLYRLIFS